MIAETRSTFWTVNILYESTVAISVTDVCLCLQFVRKAHACAGCI